MTIAGNVHRISVDRSQPLAAQPQVGHNRWHPDIPPVLRVAPGERVILETLDALDGQITPRTTNEEVGHVNLDVVHPLTGPAYVNGAEPAICWRCRSSTSSRRVRLHDPDRGFGFLRDLFDQPYIVHWTIADGYATAPELPGVRIPARFAA
jgi:formamidase